MTIPRDQIQHFLRSIGHEAAANDQPSLCLAEAIVNALGKVTKQMAAAGDRAADDAMDSTWDSDGDGEGYNSYSYLRSDAPAGIYKAMWAARFRGE